MAQDLLPAPRLSAEVSTYMAELAERRMLSPARARGYELRLLGATVLPHGQVITRDRWGTWLFVDHANDPTRKAATQAETGFADGILSPTEVLLQGPSIATQTENDPKGNRTVKSVLLTPQTITKDNVKLVVDQQYVKASELCTGDVQPLCQAAGIS